MRKIEVVPYDPAWQKAFERESKRVMNALAKNVITIHHIGSTAIPGIDAKPIIDLLVEVKNILAVDERNSSMELLGYEVMGEYGIAGRQYFRKNNRNSYRTHHVHAFVAGAAEVQRHLLFRDYMRAHSEDAQRYSELKRRLAKEYPTNGKAYTVGKNEFIREMNRKAVQFTMVSCRKTG